jgi:hypothetical protein
LAYNVPKPFCGEISAEYREFCRIKSTQTGVQEDGLPEIIKCGLGFWRTQIFGFFCVFVIHDLAEGFSVDFKAWDEFAIELEESNKTGNIPDNGWSWPMFKSLCLGIVGLLPSGKTLIPTNSNRFGKKWLFFRLKVRPLALATRS